ncbi:single-stranded DNA-binding protein [Alkalihalobacillus trypoxylicola]|uniref:Single-stranded DNA-binding protein n=1 Tax=Alkalihalobacillus trypoxylicola TaxID=519424 RepID=A0A162D597_9BACI|nr:single-stranded DNA-binding protein [Alkalihalobacillus trypoxylicola]KYG28156.1 single-stranded DNA-binding protein [Alkalihalobacillus trypoxylicola]
MNTVNLIGRLGKDAELRYSPQGTAIANFSLAVTRQYNRDETDWINVVCFKKTAENTAQYTKKGSQVGIVGRIQTRNYENNEGKRIYVTEVVADNIQFLDNKSQGDSQNTNTSQSQQNDDPFGGRPVDISDSDLPF